MTHDTRDSILPADFVAELFGSARPVTLARNKTLFLAGDPGDGCYRVAAGLLKGTMMSRAGLNPSRL